jgi:hypothetical protein
MWEWEDSKKKVPRGERKRRPKNPTLNETKKLQRKIKDKRQTLNKQKEEYEKISSMKTINESFSDVYQFNESMISDVSSYDEKYGLYMEENKYDNDYYYYCDYYFYDYYCECIEEDYTRKEEICREETFEDFFTRVLTSI